MQKPSNQVCIAEYTVKVMVHFESDEICEKQNNQLEKIVIPQRIENFLLDLTGRNPVLKNCIILVEE